MASTIDGGVVLVTGASSGIGMAIARLVAPRARTLLLVARRVEVLAKLKEELLAARPSLEVEAIGCDLSRRDQVDALVSDLATRGVEVDVLVNNAGVGMMGVFDRADIGQIVSMIDLNVTSPIVLTAALLPGMVRRGRGGVLNVSSGFGLATLPSFAAYCGTKHFMSGFTEALLADLAGTGVTVTQVCPGPVSTGFEQHIGNFTGRRVPSLIEISPERCARVAVRGFDRGCAMVIPSLVMKLVLLLNDLSPRFARRIFSRVIGKIARKKELEHAASTELVGAATMKSLPPNVRP